MTWYVISSLAIACILNRHGLMNPGFTRALWRWFSKGGRHLATKGKYLAIRLITYAYRLCNLYQPANAAHFLFLSHRVNGIYKYYWAHFTGGSNDSIDYYPVKILLSLLVVVSVYAYTYIHIYIIIQQYAGIAVVESVSNAPSFRATSSPHLPTSDELRGHEAIGDGILTAGSSGIFNFDSWPLVNCNCV